MSVGNKIDESAVQLTGELWDMPKHERATAMFTLWSDAVHRLAIVVGPGVPGGAFPSIPNLPRLPVFDRAHAGEYLAAVIRPLLGELGLAAAQVEAISGLLAAPHTGIAHSRLYLEPIAQEGRLAILPYKIALRGRPQIRHASWQPMEATKQALAKHTAAADPAMGIIVRTMLERTVGASLPDAQPDGALQTN